MPVIEPNGAALPTISREDQGRCEELLQRWMVALNSYDATGMKSVMRFPLLFGPLIAGECQALFLTCIALL